MSLHGYGVTKLQIHIDTARYERFKNRTQALGFDSPQAYVRYWMYAETNDASTSKDRRTGLADPCVQAIRFIELLLATRHAQPAFLEDALMVIAREIRRMQGKNYLDKILK